MARHKICCLLTSWFIIVLCCLSRTGTSKEDYTQCGIRSVSSRAKVVKGSRSYPGQWPWQVSIHKTRKADGTKQFHCGGALIDTKWVLTAAHCFYGDNNPQRYTIRAGDHNIWIKDVTQQERLITEILLSPRYLHFPYYANDIALVKLSQDVVLTPYVRTVCLPEANAFGLSTAGAIVHAAGWGRTSERGNLSSILLHSDYQIQNNSLCRRATKYYFNETVMFCAGDGRGISDTCQGDSGGSLVRQVLHKGAQRWVTVGLVSWGEGCARAGKYGYNTRMEPFLDWIRKITRNCGNPGRPANGYFAGAEFYEGRELQFYCYGDYSLFGSKTIRCLSNRRWNASLPECKSSCPKPWDVKNGRKIGQNYAHGQNLTYACLGLYTLVGSSSMRCNDGKWILEAQHNQWPSCKKPCTNPGTPNNGSKTGSDYRHGRQVFYSCERGTYVVGERSSTCYDGKWSNVLPVCLKICQDPGNVANGYKTENPRLYLAGDTVTYRCNPGYNLFGRAKLFCNGDGLWNNKAPICYAVECRNPGRLINGYRYPPKSKYKFKDSIRYMCKINYTLVGNFSVTCQQDKRWSGNVPRCLATCRDPGIPIGGHRYQHSAFLNNSIVQFSCNSGWTMDGSHTIRCTDGRWDHNSPTCNKACLRPNKYPINGGIRGSYSSYRHKYSIRYYCNRGYNLVGRGYVRCLNGTWENKQPTCRPIECRDPGRLVNGSRYPDKNKYVFKDRIRFQCKTNYTLRGDSSITCQQDKRWSGNVPRCLAPCRDPGIPNSGQRYDHSFLHNARVRFSCRRGWNIQGSQTITCNDGNWDHTTPECMECGSTLGMEDGKIPDGNIQASSTRYRYHAKDGRLYGRYAWCSGTARDPYLQIDFGKPYRITALATQGSAYNNRWVENYTVRSNLAGSSFNIYREDGRDKIFIGNRDKGSVIKSKLKNPVIARRLRLYPQKQGGFSGLSPACMRVEIYGCDLPSDCIQIGSRIVAKWISNQNGGFKYHKAYLKSISRRYWKVELEDENHGRPRYKYLLKYEDLPFVLDVPPKHEELGVGIRVLGAWGHTYFTGTIKTGRDRYNRYRVRADDGDEKDFTLDGIRLLKAPTFCN